MAGKTFRTRWWILTLVIAFTVGWALAPADDSEESVSSPPPGRKTKSSRQRDLLDRSNPPARLVSNLLDELDAASSADSVVPAADRAAAARTAIDTWMANSWDQRLLTEARVRLAHWLETDSEAAVRYWNGLGNREPAEELAKVVRDHFLTINPDVLTDWLADRWDLGNGSAKKALLEALANTCSEHKNLKLFERIRARLDPETARQLLLPVIVGWPTDRLELLVETVRKYPDSNVVRLWVSRMQPTTKISWIRNEIATNGSLAEILKANGMVASFIAGARGTSIKERIALIEEIEASNDSKTRSGIAPATLVQIDVSDWLSRTDADAGPLTDWRHRLRLGEISASQVMEEGRRMLPGVANEQPEEFRNRMFNELVSINPSSAMEILSTLPPQQRERTMIKAGMDVAGRGDPQHLLELASTIAPTMATPVNDRFQVWSRAARPSYEKYGESYVSWVAAMPPGIEQDWALSGLSMHFRTSDPEKSAYLASLKTLPAGWHPEK